MAQFKFGLLAASGLMALSWQSGALAQTQAAAPAGTPQASAPHGDDGTVTEIIVTANKREQRLNDVGMSVSVVGGESLQRKQVSSLADIAKQVPGLSYSPAPNGTPVYTLRGIGFYESSLGAYPSVSVYIDQAPLPFPVLTTHSAYDLERIEVLKGPQGTLFGENATGGALNYIAAAPTSTLQSGVNLTYGRFNQVTAEGFVSGPLSDTLNGRVSGRIERADGWQQSVSRPGDTNGAVRNYMGRVQLAWKPTDKLGVLLNVNGWQDKSQPQAAQYAAQQFQNEGLSSPPGAYRDPAILASPFTPHSPRAADWSTSSFLFNHRTPFANNKMLQAALHVDADIGDLGTFTSITNVIHYKQRQGNDSDGLALHALDVPLTTGKIDAFTQELRFSNGAGHRFRYVVGGNFEHDLVKQDATIQFDNSSAKLGFGALFGLPASADAVNSKQSMTNYAAFGNTEFDIREDLTLKAGVRYTDSRDRAQICQYDPRAPYAFGNLIIAFSGLFGGPAHGAYQPGDCVMINLNPATMKAAVDYLPFAGLGGMYATLHEDNISRQIGLDYKPRPGLLFYVNASRGYKAGSFPAITGSTLQQYLPVRQERVQSYEGGFKVSLLNRSLQLNGAAFSYDYKDKQLRTKLLDPTFGQLDVLQNIPKSSIKGFELEANYRPVRGLTIDAAYTYLDAKIDEYVGTNAGGDPNVNFAGARIPFTPKHQGGVNVDYEHPVSDGLVGFAGFSVNYRSDTISVVGGDTNPSTINASSVSKVYGIGSYTLVDAQIGVKVDDGRWRVALWGKNIFNKYYWTNAVSGYDTVSRYAGMPATYGVSFNYKFN